MVEEEIIESYLNGDSGVVIAERLAIPVWKIYYVLDKNQINRRHNKINSRRYKANDSFFNIIETECQAYWLGFMYADGYITIPNKIGISLGIRDKDHLYLFKRDIEATNPVLEFQGVTPYGPVRYCRILITSDQLHEDIQRQGCLKHKTKILKPPTQVPDQLIHHFIRGYIDGDGSIIVNRKHSQSKVKISGNKEFLTWMSDKIGIRGSLYKDKSIYCLDMSGSRSFEALKWVYNDANIYLERKRQKAMEIMEQFS